MDQNLINAYRYARQQGSRAAYAFKQAKEDAAAGKKRYPKSGKPYFGNWQSLDSMTRYHNRAFYMDSFPPEWRNLGNVGEIRDESCRRGRIVDHNGWYCDEFQDSTVYGVVLQFPARNGECQYFPGIVWTGSDGVTCYPLDRYDNIKDCARAADSIAEKLGEQEREYQEAWRAGNDATELEKQIKEDRRTILTTIRNAKRDLDIDAAIWRLVKDEVSSLLDDIYEARKKRDKLCDTYGRHEGFKEGYSS